MGDCGAQVEYFGVDALKGAEVGLPLYLGIDYCGHGYGFERLRGVGCDGNFSSKKLRSSKNSTFRA